MNLLCLTQANYLVVKNVNKLELNQRFVEEINVICWSEYQKMLYFVWVNWKDVA